MFCMGVYKSLVAYALLSIMDDASTQKTIPLKWDGLTEAEKKIQKALKLGEKSAKMCGGNTGDAKAQAAVSELRTHFEQGDKITHEADYIKKHLKTFADEVVTQTSVDEMQSSMDSLAAVLIADMKDVRAHHQFK